MSARRGGEGARARGGEGARVRGGAASRASTKPGQRAPRKAQRPARATRAPKSDPRTRGPVTGVTHIAIATPNADALAATLMAALGARRGEEEMLDGGELRVLFVHLGPLTLELLEPRSVHHTVTRFLGRRGPGLHHVCLEVSGIEGVLERCRAAGIQPIDETPRAGAHGARVAFLHPKNLGGVLLELCERPPVPPRGRR